MGDSKGAGSRDDTSSDPQIEKQPGRRPGRRSPELPLAEARHYKLLNMGLSFRSMVERIDDYAIFALDREGRIASWNEGGERIKGYKAEEIVGQHLTCFYTPEDIERGHPANLLKVAEEHGRVADEGWRVRKDGTLFWADVSITALRDEKGKFKGFAKVVRDATRRKRAEDALGELSTRLLEAEDNERRRISLELSDKTSPSFASLLAKLYQIRKQTQELNIDASQVVSDTIALGESLAREIRLVSYFLSPPFLNKDGLLGGLRWYVDGFARHTGISVNTEFPEKLDGLPRPTERALYRITQECLTDVLRHSASSRVNVRLSTDQEFLTLEVRSEGRSLAPSVLESLRTGTGELGVTIAGMRELMKHLGGRLNVTSSDSGVLVVSAILPLGKNARISPSGVVHDDRSRTRMGKEIVVELAPPDDPDRKQTAVTQNLSSHGTRLTTEHAWRRGEGALVSSPQGGVRTEAKVVYCEYLGSDKFAVGLELVKPLGNWATPS